MNTEGYEQLMRNHAHWADRVRALRRAGGDALDRCACDHDGETCIGHAFKTCGEMNREAAPYDEYTFEEVWFELLAEGKVCDACQELRRLKADRIEASKRLGAVRAAITRVGRGIDKREAS